MTETSRDPAAPLGAATPMGWGVTGCVIRIRGWLKGHRYEFARVVTGIGSQKSSGDSNSLSAVMCPWGSGVETTFLIAKQQVRAACPHDITHEPFANRVDRVGNGDPQEAEFVRQPKSPPCCRRSQLRP